MSRLALYLVDHNYRKRYRVKAPVGDGRVHGEVAGIDRDHIGRELEAMFGARVFPARTRLPATLGRIWRKTFTTPLRPTTERLQKLALC
jgi:hypothetical protein